MIPEVWLTQATSRLKDQIVHTPLTHDTTNDLYLKWENRQRTGSFKLRGALNKVLTLEDWERQRGLVTASAGNHGQGVALAAREAGAKVTVFASEHAVPAKLEAMRALGAEIRLVPGGYAEAEKTALSYAAQTQSTWVSPYNDGQVIAGQGTLGLEIIAQMPVHENYTCLVPVGGGGLIAGIGAAIACTGRRITLVGVQSEASPFMHTLYCHGAQEDVVEYESLADGLAGMVEPGSITIPMVQKFVDSWVLVTEEEISQAIAYSWYHYSEKIEGSAASALAAALTGKIAERPIVIVITGGNIQPEMHSQICDRWRDIPV
jgi:threonine dehydratase